MKREKLVMLFGQQVAEPCKTPRVVLASDHSLETDDVLDYAQLLIHCANMGRGAEAST
jgi:hypothetical protein